MTDNSMKPTTSEDQTHPLDRDVALVTGLLDDPHERRRCTKQTQVPKKTKLYVEQTQRAKLQAGEIHRAFQKDLCLLRLTAARAYVKTITDGRQGVSAVGAATSLRLHAQCQGLVRGDW